MEGRMDERKERIKGKKERPCNYEIRTHLHVCIKFSLQFHMAAAKLYSSFQRDCDGSTLLNICVSVCLSQIGFTVLQSDLMLMNYLILAIIFNIYFCNESHIIDTSALFPSLLKIEILSLIFLCMRIRIYKASHYIIGKYRAGENIFFISSKDSRIL